MIYNELLEECFFYPRHVGDLTSEKSELSRISNSLIRAGENLWMGFLYDNDKILKARFKAQGAPYSIAALEWLCRETEGQSLTELSSIDYQKIIGIFSIPDTYFPAALRVSDLYNGLIASIQNK